MELTTEFGLCTEPSSFQRTYSEAWNRCLENETSRLDQNRIHYEGQGMEI